MFKKYFVKFLRARAKYGQFVVVYKRKDVYYHYLLTITVFGEAASMKMTWRESKLSIPYVYKAMKSAYHSYRMQTLFRLPWK